MEHAGAIFYNAPALLLDESASQAQLLARASLIAHETAHMWFGDLVTMRWFDDVWMKEVFANFFAAKIVNPAFPELEPRSALPARALSRRLRGGPHGGHAPDPAAARQPGRSRFALRRHHLPEGADRDAAARAHAGRGRVPRRGARVPGARMRSRNASWTDLVALLDRRTPTDLAAWSRVWVEEPGRPIVDTALVLDGAGRIESAVAPPIRPGHEWIARGRRHSTCRWPPRPARRSASPSCWTGPRSTLARRQDSPRLAMCCRPAADWGMGSSGSTRRVVRRSSPTCTPCPMPWREARRS